MMDRPTEPIPAYIHHPLSDEERERRKQAFRDRPPPEPEPIPIDIHAPLSPEKQANRERLDQEAKSGKWAYMIGGPGCI